jgi:hypothetical protein
LLARLRDEQSEVRQATIKALAHLRGDHVDRKLLSDDLDGMGPWLDPQMPITTARLVEAARKLKLSTAAVRLRYEKLAPEYCLNLDLT